MHISCITLPETDNLFQPLFSLSISSKNIENQRGSGGRKGNTFD